MFCSKCGNQLKDGAKFCNKCGNKIDSKLQDDSTKVMEPVQPIQPSTTNVQATKEIKAVKKEKTGSGKGLIIGLSIGIGILALAVILVVVYLFFGDIIFSKETTKVEVKTEQNDSNKNNTTTTSNDYKIPDSNSRYLTDSELQSMSTYDLYIARNEIYARHGRDFKKDDLKQYFGSKSWYHVQYTPEYFDANTSTLLNDYERKNAEKMLAIEKTRNSPYLVT